MLDGVDAGPFVDPAGLVAFWQREYLEGYVGAGGGTVKWLRGREGSGKTRVLRATLERAAGLGYLTATADAGTGALGRFDDLYREMMAQIPLDALAHSVARTAAAQVGAAAWQPSQGLSVEAYLRSAGRPASVVQDDVARCLDFLFASPNLDPPVAAAARRLAMPYVADGEAARGIAAVAAQWLRGQRLRASERRQSGIYLALDRYSARDVLRSLLHLLQMVGMPGMVWAVDRVEAVLVRRGAFAAGADADASRAPAPPGVPYTAQRRLDAYEGIREFIDEGGRLPGLMIVYAGRPEVFDDERAGLVTYPALAMRVQTEIEADLVNLYNDVQDLDRLWQADWPRHEAALVEAYGANGAARGADLAGVLSGSAVSPVRRLVERLAELGAASAEGVADGA